MLNAMRIVTSDPLPRILAPKGMQTILGKVFGCHNTGANQEVYMKVEALFVEFFCRMLIRIITDDEFQNKVLEALPRNFHDPLIDLIDTIVDIWSKEDLLSSNSSPRVNVEGNNG